MKDSEIYRYSTHFALVYYTLAYGISFTLKITLTLTLTVNYKAVARGTVPYPIFKMLQVRYRTYS